MIMRFRRAACRSLPTVIGLATLAQTNGPGARRAREADDERTLTTAVSPRQRIWRAGGRDPARRFGARTGGGAVFEEGRLRPGGPGTIVDQSAPAGLRHLPTRARRRPGQRAPR